MGLSCVSMKTLKNHERMDVSWANHVYNTEFSVKKLAYTIVGGKFRENKRVSLKKPVYNVLLH